MKTVAIIQARMGSTRLPGKVLLPLAGRSVLEHTISRVRACHLLDGVVVATTVGAADDAIAAEAYRCGATVFRGSEPDVLTRYYQAAVQEGAKRIVRVTSDCPLFDGQLLRKMLERFKQRSALGRIDYLSNTLERTFPRGLDAEVFTFEALKEAYDKAATPAEREHVTPYLYNHPEKFALENFASEKDLSAYRWTLDTAEDYQMIGAICSSLCRLGAQFSTFDVLEFLAAHPEIVALNAHVEQKTLGA